MERKKPLPQPSSSSDESSSNEEGGNEQNFVRSDRNTQKIEDKKAQKADEDEDDDEDEDEDDEDEEENDDDAFDGTQKVNAIPVAEEDSSSETEQAGPADGGSDSDSSTNSASEGKSDKPSHRFVVLPRKPEIANGHGKKVSASEKPSKSHPKAEVSPKKGKDKASKRDRDVEPQEKGSSKKHKKESTDKPSKSVEHLPKAKDAEKVSKEKNPPSHTSEKKNEGKKSVHATAVAEKSKNMSSQQNSSKKPENASAKKAAEKSKNDKKVAKDPEPEPSKGPFSPAKPKLFTAKDEIVLTSEVLHDIKQGIEIPTKKIDGYWNKLVDRVKGRMEGDWTKEQLCEKVKRMKVRYTSMAEKFKDSEERKFRNSTDKELFGLWDQIWGSGDAMKVDHDREVAEVKDKQTKFFVAASPVKGGKAQRDKVIAPVQDVKVVHEESEGHKNKHTDKQSSDEDVSESEESEREGDLQKKDLTVTPMEVDRKDAHALVPKGNAVQGHESNTHSHSISDAQKLFQEEIRATLLELQESSKQTLKEWQNKALAVVQNVVKAAADQSRLVNGIGVGGFDGLFTPFRSLDLIDSQQAEGDQALQQQWHELRLKELDVYRQKLELMQRECQLKQDQLELQLHRSK